MSDRAEIIETMARAIERLNPTWKAATAEAEAALTALEASGRAVVPGWQPIESAPKDGTRFIAWVQWADGGNWHECWWEPTGWWVEVATRDHRRPAVPIKGWQPLPAPPPHTQEKDA